MIRFAITGALGALGGMRRKTLRTRRRRIVRSIESLEPRAMLDASVIISEVMAVNDDVLFDEDGDNPDWFELLNVGSQTADLTGWHVTDDADDLNRWQLPPTRLQPGEHLLLFASGKDRDNPTRPLHTDFKLSRAGEYLALTRPDQTIEFEFSPAFPTQVEDVSFGVPSQLRQTTLVDIGAQARVHIPTDVSLDPTDLANDQIANSWLDPDLNTDHPAWFAAEMGIGFVNEANDTNPRPGEGTVIASSVTEFSRRQNRDDWRYGYWNLTDDDNGVYDGTGFKSFTWSGLSTVSANNHWDGTKWDLAVDPATPNTELSDVGGHPNGANSGDVHHVVRRWTSEVTGSILVHGRLENADATGDGVIARIFIDGHEAYWRQINGRGMDYRTVLSVNEGSKVDFLIDPGDAHNDIGDGTVFTATIEDVTALIGDQGGLPSMSDEIATNIEDQMKGIASSAYVRIPFVPATAAFDSLVLNVQYDDAFVAYLNGRPIASAGGPQPIDAAWNSTATDDRDVEAAVRYQSFNATDALDGLIAGTENVLMLHAINHSSDDDDLLLSAQLVATTFEIGLADRRYFITPTPAAANGLGDATVGPLFVDRSHSPLEPQANDPIVVSTSVAASFHPIDTVSLTYRVMYGAERTLVMKDDGSGDDAIARDGVFTATIPAGLADAGEMIRWYLTARDDQQQETRWPRFDDPRDSEQYFGTVVVDPAVESNLPIFHWFAQNRNRAFTGSGTQGSLFHDGEFYDNVTFDIHGQSSSGFPTTKKSMDVDFPRDHRFRWNDETPRMKDINLLTNFADKSKLRNTLAYEQRALIGDGYHLAFPVRVQHNGDFFAVYDFVEDGDDRWLDRLGLDAEGALYKMYNRMDAPSGEKKTRKEESNNDLRELVNGVNLSGDDRTNFIFDNIDLAAMANYLAGFVLTSNTDCCHKNYYAYRDTNGSGEWRYLPWDVDLTQGRNWGGFGLAYFDDTMYADNDLFMGRNNRLISALYATPGFEEMYLRRVRTVMDAYVKPPGTPSDQLPLETRVDELVGLLSDDADLDNARHPATWGQTGRQTFPEAADILKNEYAGPRRDFLYQTQVMADDSQVRVIVSGTPGETAVRYFVPNDDSLGTSWTQLGFDDRDWQQGATGVGYEMTPQDYDHLLRTDLKDEMNNRTSAFVRIPFHLDSLDDLDELTLRMKYDDGFVAYLNGSEVARRGVGAGAVSFDMTASSHSDRLAVEFENLNITNFRDRFVVGENLLAIQVVNSSASSSDLLILPELVEGTVSDAGGPIPTAQRGNPKLDFGVIDFNPASGNQEDEYLQLINNQAVAVDISGWQLTGGIEMTFKPGTVLPAGWSLHVTPDAKAFRARAAGPAGGQGLFVQGGYNGHLSNHGETLHLVGADGQWVNSTTYDGAPTDWQQHLRITEVMYHPLAPNAAELAQHADWTESDFEFIELQNMSSSVTLDLNGVRFSNGVLFDFSSGSISMLGPSERLLVVANEDAFAARYGRSSKIAGEFALSSGLRDSGETLKLEDPTNSTIVEFGFSDDVDRGWPRLADGRGASLQVVDPEASYSAASNWRASDRIQGTPGGAPEALASPLVINEILTQSVEPERDAIELFNAGDPSLQLEHYYLSDAADDLDGLSRFAIPASTVAGRAFMVLTESDFNAGGPGDPNSFTLSSTRGDQLYLTIGNADGPTHFVDVVEFPASAPNESFGRTPDGSGPLAPMAQITIGAPNRSPRVGPVLISELHYHPADASAVALAIAPDLDANDLEFVEIHNSSRQVVDLTDWRLRGDVDFDFPPGQLLAAEQTLLILSFSPSRPENSARRQAFLSEHGLPVDTQMIGGYSGQLDNDGHRLTLQRPGTPSPAEPLQTPRLWEDEIRFDDSPPWPGTADGEGDSLQRRQASALGLLVDSWSASTPTPGQVQFSTLPNDFNGDGRIDVEDVDYFSSQLQSPAPDLAADLTGDQIVDDADRDQLILIELNTTYGDANLDGVFNSSDLIAIFTVGEYEDDQDGNSTWADGDWDMDGDFMSSDIILAFAAGGYTLGVRSGVSPSVQVAGNAPALPFDPQDRRAITRRSAAVAKPVANDRRVGLEMQSRDLVFAEWSDAVDSCSTANGGCNDRPNFDNAGTLRLSVATGL